MNVKAKLIESLRKRKSDKIIKPDQLMINVIDVKPYKENAVEIKTTHYKGYAVAISITGCDIMNFQENDMSNAFESFSNATMAIRTYSHKYIFSDTTPDLTLQKKHIQYRLEKSSNDKCKRLLLRELEYFNNIEYNQRDRQTYLLIYGNDIADMQMASNLYVARISQYCNARKLSSEEALELMQKVLHRGSTIYSDSVVPSKVQLSSNYYLVNDEKYCTTLTCHTYPSFFYDLTLAELIFKLSGTEVTLDVIMDKREKSVEELKGSIREIDSRDSISQERTDEIDNCNDIADLTELYTNVRRCNERLMKATMRIHLSADSIDKLNKDIEDCVLKLSEIGLEAHINENEMLTEYKSLIVNDNPIRTAFPLQDTYKRQFPFYYQSHIDDNGLYFGTTYTGGLVLLDTFLYDKKVRTSFDVLLIGTKGSGKSATLKAMTQDAIALGHKVMILDVENEYYSLCNELGGSVVKLSSTSTINPLELRRSIIPELDSEDKKVSPEEALALNYTSELSRIAVFFSQYIPSISDIELDELKDLLVETYLKFGIDNKTDLSKLTPEDYPIFSDLLETIRCKLYESGGAFNKELTTSKRAVYEHLETWIKPLAEGMYAGMFNGHSSFAISDEKMIVFNVSALSELEERVYNSLLFQLLTMMWAEICDNAYYNKVINHVYDRSYVVSLIDEAHKFINRNNPECTKFINKLTRRSRKYDAGLWFASQSITDFSPQGTVSDNDTIKDIFGLVQYKMILKQPSEAVETLHQAFPQFTYSELAATDNFIPGEMLISLGGKSKLRCRRYINEDDLSYFGNSRDKKLEGGDAV